MPWGDRYDARAGVVGIAVLLVGGVGGGIGLHGGVAAWLTSVALACAAMNVTSHLLRVRAKRSARARGGPAARHAEPISAAEFRRRLPIVATGVTAAVLVAVVCGLTLGSAAAVPAAISGAVIAALMLFVMLRGRAAQ